MLGLLLVSPSWAAEPCGNFPNKILVTSPVSIENAFNDYQNSRYKNSTGDSILLCFTSFSTFPGDVLKSLSLVNTSSLPVYIEGLNIKTDATLTNAPLLNFGGSKPIIFSKNKLSCSSKQNTIGIKLAGESHQIQESEILNCGVGAQVEGNKMQVGPNNIIHDNGIGVKIANGSGNLVQKNSVYMNNSNNDDQYAQEEGIYIMSGTNNNVTSPIIYKKLENSAQVDNVVAQTDNDILNYPEGVTDLPADNEPPVLATFSMELVDLQGQVQIDLVRQELYPRPQIDSKPDPFQGREFFADADCVADSNLLKCQIPMTQGKKNQKALLLFHHPEFGSSTYSLRFNLNGPGLVSAAGMGPGTGVVGDPSLPPPSPEEEKSDSGSGIGASTPSGEAPATVMAGGIGANGAPGGVKSGGWGAPLDANDSPSSLSILLSLSLFLTLLAYRRRVRGSKVRGSAVRGSKVLGSRPQFFLDLSN